MSEKIRIRILGQECLLPLNTQDPEFAYPYIEALSLYKNLIKDLSHLKTYALHRKNILEKDFPLTILDVYEGLFQLGISPGQERLYSLGVLYYLLECPKHWGVRIGPNKKTFFCYQGALNKIENVYEEYEKEQKKKKLKELKRKKKKKKLKKK